MDRSDNVQRLRKMPGRGPGGPGRGPGGHGRGPGGHGRMVESAKDAKGSFVRLITYFGTQKFLLLLAGIVIFIGVFLGVTGPAVLGKAITNYLERDPNLSLFMKEVFVLLAIYTGAWISEVLTRLLLTKTTNNIIFNLSSKQIQP